MNKHSEASSYKEFFCSRVKSANFTSSANHDKTNLRRSKKEKSVLFFTESMAYTLIMPNKISKT